MTYNIPRYSENLSNIHDYLNKHQWEEICSLGVFNEKWLYCSVCGLITAKQLGFAGTHTGRMIRPEKIIRLGSAKPWGFIPSDIRKQVAHYLFDISWHVVDGKIDSDRVALLRSQISEGYGSLRVTTK